MYGLEQIKRMNAGQISRAPKHADSDYSDWTDDAIEYSGPAVAYVDVAVVAYNSEGKILASTDFRAKPYEAGAMFIGIREA